MFYINLPLARPSPSRSRFGRAKPGGEPVSQIFPYAFRLFLQQFTGQFRQEASFSLNQVNVCKYILVFHFI